MSVLRRAAVSQITTPNSTLAEDVRDYSEAGWGAIGVWLNKLERETMPSFWFPEQVIPRDKALQAGELISKAGLRVSHVIGGGLYSNPDRRITRRRVNHSVAAAKTTTQLGGDCLLVVPGPLHGRPKKAVLEQSRAALQAIIDETSEVRLAVEPVGRDEVDFVNTLAEALELVDQVNDRRVGICIDTYHLWDSSDLLGDIRRAEGRIFAVHLSDGWKDRKERAIPGEGRLPLTDIVRAIDDTGYAGFYDVEVPSAELRRCPTSEILERCAQGVTRVLSDAGVRPG